MSISKKLGVSAALLQSLAACGAAPDEFVEDGASPGEPVGEVREALNETAVDRPLVAAIRRRFDGSNGIWLFACDTNNRMRRNVGTTGGSWPTGWFTVSNNWNCASPPSVGKWVNETPTGETIAVYWRSLADKLIEARYRADGSVTLSNLSDSLGFGPIAGSPVVADSTNRTDYSQRFSVAVVKATSRELYTLDYYQGAWHPAKPVLLDTGATATVLAGTSIVALHSTTGIDAHLSIQHNFGAHMIFKRRYWSNSYTQYAYTATGNGLPKGVVTFMGDGTTPKRCPSALCALIRDPADNRPKLADLVSAGGNLTNRFARAVAAPPSFPPSLEPRVASSFLSNAYPHSAVHMTYPVLANGHVGFFGGLSGAVADLGFGASISSATTPAAYAGEHVFYTVGASNTLHYFMATASSPAPFSLELDVLP
jgi:hypothetical protein